MRSKAIKQITNAPCYGCQKRAVDCHATCDKYLEYRRINDEYKAAKDRVKKLERDAYNYADTHTKAW